MENNCARTLSENQKQKSISGAQNAKNAARKSIVRNVFAKAYLDHWPVVDESDGRRLTALLERVLPVARKPTSDSVSQALKQLRGKGHKEERQALREKLWQENPEAKDLRLSLALGVNDVSRSLEGGELGSLVIAHEADPPLLTRHLGALAAARQIPYLVLPGLKNCVKNSLHFSSLAVGFKKSVAKEKEHPFHEIHNLVVDISRTLVLRLASKKVEVVDIDNIEISESTERIHESKPKLGDPSELYLKRQSNQYRAFVPGKGVATAPNTAWPQFLSLSTSSTAAVSDTGSNSTSLLKFDKTPLGVEDIPNRPAFLQRVRQARVVSKKSSASTEVSTEPIVSLGIELEHGEPMDVDIASSKLVKPKHDKRYFSATLVPLKVKRMQANPKKIKKRKIRR